MLDKNSWQVIGQSKTTTLDFTKKAGFYLTSNGDADKPDVYSKFGEESPFWQMIITDYRESHADAVNVINTFASCNIIQSMGALPIQINCSGYLYTTTTEDHRMDFLYVYNEAMRGSLNWEHDIIVNFFVKDTYMQLFFTRIDVENTSQFEDMTKLTFTGVGFKYRCI